MSMKKETKQKTKLAVHRGSLHYCHHCTKLQISRDFCNFRSISTLLFTYSTIPRRTLAGKHRISLQTGS